MNALIRLKKTTPVFVIAFVLAWFALSPTTQAVVPPPDGGYPGFNTAEGQNALFSLTTGSANTAVGWYSLFSNTEGNFNTATGAGALIFNTAREIRPLARRPFYSTAPALRIQRLERLPF